MRPLGYGHMTKDTLLIDLARVTHELWRLRLESEGWRPGPYKPEGKVHDALVPFERLTRADRLILDSHVRDEQIEEALTDTLRYPRGPDRPFLVEEMVIGLAVVFAQKGCPERLDEVPDELHGAVINWTTDASGELSQIAVRWNTGVVSEYDPWFGELVRASELT